MNDCRSGRPGRLLSVAGAEVAPNGSELLGQALRILVAVVAVAVVFLLVIAAFAQGNGRPHTTIDLEFVVLRSAVDHKPLYLNPRAVTYIAPHDEKITRIGLIGGDVRSVEGHVDAVAAALLAPLPLGMQLQIQPAKGGQP